MLGVDDILGLDGSQTSEHTRNVFDRPVFYLYSTLNVKEDKKKNK